MINYRFTIALLALAFGLGVVQVSATDETAAAKSEVRSSSRDLPIEAQSAISAAVGSNELAYKVNAHVGYASAENSQNHLSAVFKTDGVHIRAGAAQMGIALAGYGYGADISNTWSVAPHVHSNRVEYRRGSLTEWYLNGPFGLEQGFTLTARPKQKHSGPLTIMLALSGDLRAVPESDKGFALQDQDRHEVLRY